MSKKKVNVNPDHYKVAGRERQGEHVVIEDEKNEVRRIQARYENRTGPRAPQKKK
ncbi:MAG TPA: hypothetical protein VIL97_11490 [Thermoanaerobaculia bacterium]